MSDAVDPGDGELVSRTYLELTSDERGVSVSATDVTPDLEPFLAGLNWQGHAVHTDKLTLGPASWPRLKAVGLPHVGAEWRGLPDSTLWAAHAAGMGDWRRGIVRDGTPTLLEIKVELARRESSPCRLCALRCLARREDGERGPCGAGKDTRAFTFQILSAEEPGLGRAVAPRLSGCNAHCRYCSRPDGIPALGGYPVSTSYVSRWIERHAAKVDALHWIGGNVDQELPFILDVMQTLRTPLPVIWNHNATGTPEITIALLEGVVDVFLPDLRYGPGPCASETGAPAMSFQNCTACIKAEMQQEAAVAVRHLALPGHIECCSHPVLEWLSAYRDRVFVSLMGCNYFPSHQARRDAQLGRRLNDRERRALHLMTDHFRLRRVS